jgi:hypothetical protein
MAGFIKVSTRKVVSGKKPLSHEDFCDEVETEGKNQVQHEESKKSEV